MNSYFSICPTVFLRSCVSYFMLSVGDQKKKCQGNANYMPIIELYHMLIDYLALKSMQIRNWGSEVMKHKNEKEVKNPTHLLYLTRKWRDDEV